MQSNFVRLCPPLSTTNCQCELENFTNLGNLCAGLRYDM
jgi:hypothetical protein